MDKEEADGDLGRGTAHEIWRDGDHVEFGGFCHIVRVEDVDMFPKAVSDGYRL